MDYSQQIEYAKQLNQSPNEVFIIQSNFLEANKQQIQEYEDKKEFYRVQINFYHFSTKEQIMEVINLVDQMGVADKVGIVNMYVTEDDDWNQELVTKITHSYKNAYNIMIDDYTQQLKLELHALLKQWVQNAPLLFFRLQFIRVSEEDDQGIKMLKEYNELIGQKKDLGVVQYGINDQCQYADSKELIEQMVESISKL